MEPIAQTTDAVHWDTRYVLTRSLIVQVTEQGRLVANNSVSRTPQQLSPHILIVLLCFLEGTTPRAAFEQLRDDDWEIDTEEFEAVVAKMIRLNYLTPVAEGDGQTEAVSLASQGFASGLSHHHMLRDVQRVMTYRAAIFKHAAGQDVLEIGCGTGILSIFAAQAGARRIVAVEESEIGHLARAMFEANGCAGRVDLRLANSRDVELDAPVDLIIHEIINTDPFSENILPYVDDARRRFLKPGGRLIPHRLEVCCVGFEVDEKTRVLREAGELAGLYGVNFDPFIQWLDEAKAVRRANPRQYGAEGRILSDESRLFDIDLYDDVTQLPPEVVVPLTIRHRGLLGGVTVYFRAHLDAAIRLTNAPFALPTHWGRKQERFPTPHPVRVGDEIILKARLETQIGYQRLVVELG